MNEQDAYELSGGWRELDAADHIAEDTEPLTYRAECVKQAVEGLIPEPTAWHVRDSELYPELYVVAGDSLFIVTCDRGDADEDDQGFRVKVARMDPKELRAGLTERLEMTHGTTFRQRRWTFAIEAGEATLEVDTEENLRGTGGPDRDELFARALAAATGWPDS